MSWRFNCQRTNSNIWNNCKQNKQFQFSFFVFFSSSIFAVGIGIFSWFAFMCFRSPLYHAYDIGHSVQLYGLFPVWITKCFCKDSLLKNTLSHWSHFWVFCFSWILLMCFRILLFVLNFISQKSQWYGLIWEWMRSCMTIMFFDVAR